MENAAPGTVVALAAGNYDQPVALSPGITLWGACPGGTVLSAPQPLTATDSAIEVLGTDTEIRNLRISGERVGIRVAGADRSVRVKGVIIDGARHTGIIATDRATAEIDTVLVQGTRAGDGGQASRDGYGISVSGGANVTVERAVFANNHAIGVEVAGAETRASLFSAVVRDTQPDESGYGYGLLVRDAARVEVYGSVFERNTAMTVRLQDPDTHADLQDIIIRDTHLSSRTNGLGKGLSITDGASADVSRGLFERNTDVAIEVFDIGGSATLADIVVRDTRAPAPELGTVGGYGLYVSDGARVRTERLLLTENALTAILITDPGSQLDMRDLIVRDTLATANTGGGTGLMAIFNTEVTIERGLFANNQMAAIFTNASDLTLNDVTLRDTLPNSYGQFGTGLAVLAGSEVSGSRLNITDNSQVGVWALGDGALACLSDVVIANTKPIAVGDLGSSECCQQEFGGSSECCQQKFGYGISVTSHSALGLKHFSVQGNYTVGGQVDADTGSGLYLSDGVIQGHPVGLHIHTERGDPGDQYDLAHILDSVSFEYNDRNVVIGNSGSLPVPTFLGETP